MKYDFVEIGTNNFDTLIQLATNERGISIEPLKFYLDELPDKPNVTKLNCAISDKSDKGTVYYVDREKIKKYNLPSWAQGCCSFNKPHVTVSNMFKNLGLDDNEFSKYETEVITPKELIDRYDITEIDFLKVDTEGHDCQIINEFVNHIIPKKIKFETNVLTQSKEICQVLRRLISLGYKIISVSDDTTLIYVGPQAYPNSSVSIVSFLFNIGNDMNSFISRMKYFFDVDRPMIIFTDYRYCHLFPTTANIYLYPCTLEEFDSYRFLGQAEKAFEKGGLMHSLANAKYRPIYHVMTWSKFDAIEKAIEINPFNSEKFVWIDIGLWQFLRLNDNFGNEFFVRRIIDNIAEKIKLCRINYNYQLNTCVTPYAGGFMTGNKSNWEKLIKYFRDKRSENIDSGYASLEEHILGEVYKEIPELFDNYYGHYLQIFDNYFNIKFNLDKAFEIINSALEKNDLVIVKDILEKINRESVSKRYILHYKELCKKYL